MDRGWLCGGGLGLSSLLSLAGPLWFLDSGHPPASRWGAADGVMMWWVASLSRRLRSQERLPVALTNKPSNPPPGGTRAHSTLPRLQELFFLSLAYDLYPSCDLLCTGAVPIVWCVCVNRGRYHFHWTLFFSLLSSPPTRFLFLSSLFLSVPPVPLSFFPVLLYPVTAQLFGTPRGRSTEKASPLPVHCRA